MLRWPYTRIIFYKQLVYKQLNSIWKNIKQLQFWTNANISNSIFYITQKRKEIEDEDEAENEEDEHRNIFNVLFS